MDKSKVGFPLCSSTTPSGHISSRTVDFDQESASNSFVSNFLMQKVPQLVAHLKTEPTVIL